MYRNYLPKYVNARELKSLNKCSPKDLKYCNGFCQELRSINDFTICKVLCNKCRKLINLGRKKIQDGNITLEEFKKNPNIVCKKDRKVNLTSKKLCIICKQNKTLLSFSKARKQCKACIAIKASIYNSDIGSFITDIELLRNDIVSLKRLVENIPKDKLVQIISHFQIGRKATDTKYMMIENVVLHFNKRLDPFICRGKCGLKLSKKYHTCKTCEKKKAKTKRSLQVFIKTVLPDIIKNLKTIDSESYHLFNKDELKYISKELGLTTYNLKKDATIKVINEEMIKRKNQLVTSPIKSPRDCFPKDSKEKNQKEIKISISLTRRPPRVRTRRRIPKKISPSRMISSYNLETKDLLSFSRNDGYINATQMCKDFGKNFQDWYDLEVSKVFINDLSSIISIPPSELVKFSQNHEDIWIHPELILQIAQWVSPSFALKVRNWINELLS